MAGVQIEVDVRGINRIRARIAKLGGLNTGALLNAIGAEVESQTRRRIEEEKADPDGVPWPDWSQAYARTRHAGHRLLEGEGDLLDSIQYTVTGDTVEVGSNLVYAAIHQFGGAEVGMNIPPRPFLGLSPVNEAELADVVEDFIDGVLA